MEGWVKLYRDIEDTWMWRDPKKLRAWLWILNRVSHKGFENREAGKAYVKIARGEVLTSILRMANENDMDRRTVARFLDDLVRSGFIAQRKTAHYTVITVVNWETAYTMVQRDPQRNVQPDEQRDAQRTPTYKKVKTVKNVKKQHPVKSHPVVDQWNDMAVACGLRKVRAVTASRVGHINAKLKIKEFDWDSILGSIPKSPHLLGHNNRGWQVTFDWIFVHEGNWPKILEGNYEQAGAAVAVKDKPSAFDTFCGPHCQDKPKIALFRWVDKKKGLTLDAVLAMAIKGEVYISPADEGKLKEWLNG